MSSPDPVLVEITRGDIVESAHVGAVVVADAEGRIVLQAGDVERPVYPRSAIKALQALPLVETGAADRFALSQEALALACSSHSGEAGHVAMAGAMLSAAGRGPEALECGADWPLKPEIARDLARAGGAPSALHNNCSGKHAGFVCLAENLGVDPAGYVNRDHPVQAIVAEAVSAVTGHPIHADTPYGVEGCTIPTFAIPLTRLAHGFARFGTGHGLPPERARAAKRLRTACGCAPFMVAGTGRFCTEAMTLLGERVFVKTGAEGVFCAALPDRGLGVALKCRDGGTRASEVMMAAVIAKFVAMSAAEETALQRFVRPKVTNARKSVVGEMRPAGLLA